ncbi:hypothetical protein E1B28_009169 [Marasmius oreades]|uniref:Uncharacterized protein n=1 Tax=Marasmius oreades TaxID=181124 RepID=A0A9P7UV14_9AGAR|nr:uncharacterized protein E1B28_009169 [Marasmius oreades]KAG7092854.1 hypothetical protein E1B28_009169 [Marasmius oreades]
MEHSRNVLNTVLLPRPRPIRLPPITGPYPPPPLPSSTPSDDEGVPPLHIALSCPPRSTPSANKRCQPPPSDADKMTSTHAKKLKNAMEPVSRSTKHTGNNGKDKDERVPKKGKGRTTDAMQYSNNKMHQLLDLFQKYLPMGTCGWEAVLQEYNKWAKKNGYTEWEWQPLQTKWSNMVKIATEHPTGDADCLEIYEEVIVADNKVNKWVVVGELQDSSESEDGNDRKPVIDISSDEEQGSVVEVKKEKGMGKEKRNNKGLATTKAFRIEAPLPSNSNSNGSRTSHAWKATEVLQSIAAAADPQHQHQLQEQCTSSTLQVIQYQHLQSQVSSLRQQVSELTNRLQ